MAGSHPPLLDIQPPLLNSACPWATTLEELRALYSCGSTGAVTTRTTLINGFAHDPNKHQYRFFNVGGHDTVRDGVTANSSGDASLNSLGYSPIPLEEYLEFIRTISDEQPSTSARSKYFIISVTGTPEEVAECYKLVASAATSIQAPLAVELNLSCPNIPGAPPPAYSGPALAKYLVAVSGQIASNAESLRLPFGIKTPPYTHATEYKTLIDTLLDSAADGGGVAPLSFITATNTLGSCLVLDSNDEAPVAPVPSLPGAGIGGMAGAPLHPLALGNVATLRRMLDEHQGQLGHVRIVGVGGVLGDSGYSRMRAAGASAVALATGLGLKGVGIFGEIETGLGGNW